MTLSATLVDPAYFTYPEYAYTYGPEVCDLAALADFPPDPEQELALNVLFGVGEDGKSSVFEFADICARQNMKTGLFKQAALGWVYVTEQRLIVWSAHEMDTTREAFIDLVTMIENCAPLRKRLAPGPTNGVYRGNGTEAIEFKSGQRIKFKARTKGGGRGLSGDRVILDEGFALKGSHMGSLMPTLSARPDPQVVIGSSAGHEDSEVLRRIRNRGRAGTSPRLAYMEFCAPEDSCDAVDCDHELGSRGCALDDERMWRMANPALGRRITVEYIRSERDALPPAEFARERLGWWDKGLDEINGSKLIDMDVWAKMAEANPAVTGQVALGVDMTADQRWVSIGAATWTQRKRIRLEVGYHKAPSDDAVRRIMHLIGKFDPCALVINGSSPAKSLVPELYALGIEPEVMTTSQNAEACTGFYNDAVNEKLSHAEDDRLTDALRGVEKRELQGGAWVLNYLSPVIISPLQASIGARWGLVKFGATAPKQTPLVDESAKVEADAPLDVSGFDSVDLMMADF